jgi:hypothetical protein
MLEWLVLGRIRCHFSNAYLDCIRRLIASNPKNPAFIDSCFFVVNKRTKNEEKKTTKELMHTEEKTLFAANEKTERYHHNPKWNYAACQISPTAKEDTPGNKEYRTDDSAWKNQRWDGEQVEGDVKQPENDDVLRADDQVPPNSRQSWNRILRRQSHIQIRSGHEIWQALRVPIAPNRQPSASAATMLWNPAWQDLRKPVEVELTSRPWPWPWN